MCLLGILAASLGKGREGKLPPAGKPAGKMQFQGIAYHRYQHGSGSCCYQGERKEASAAFQLPSRQI